MYNRPLGGFGQGWQGNGRGGGQRGGWGGPRGGWQGQGGRGNYMNRGGMRPQSWGPMPNAPMGSYGNQWSSNQNPAWGAPQQQQGTEIDIFCAFETFNFITVYLWSRGTTWDSYDSKQILISFW